uniref:Beta-lactamase domain-containing protein n=1 Tax=Syphacia muris TaxID=451379 RepID=A0A0N5AZZ1_9BILA
MGDANRSSRCSMPQSDKSSLYYDILVDSECSGMVRDDLKEIVKRFSKLLVKERQGLALAAYENDTLVVDLWGGFADKKKRKVWKENTMTVAFSTSKVIGALIVAILVSRGYLKYEDLVITYWPEYGQNGKEETTVEWLVGHKAGLITFDVDFSLSQCNDYKYLSGIIEKTKPRWKPGTVTAYHALTYGFLIDQLVRRVDPKKRGVGDFFREEIVPFMKETNTCSDFFLIDKDFYIGLPDELFGRMAKVTFQRQINIAKYILKDAVYIKVFLNSLLSGYCYWNSPVQSATRYPSCLNLMKPATYKDSRIWKIENLSAFGICTARGLASAISAIMSHDLISAEIWDILSRPTEYVKDEVIQLHHYRGHGFFYRPHPTRKNSFILEHSGNGMQKVVFDPITKVSIAVLRNGLTWNFKKERESDYIASNILKQLK